MKKNVKSILTGFVAAALLAGLSSCSNGSSDNTGKDDIVQTITFEETTSILEGIQDGDNVWGSGTKTTKNSDNTYKVVAAGAGQGDWGGNIAAIPVCFGAGDLTGYTYIIIEADISSFTLNADNDEYPPIELKLETENSQSKIINATSLLKNQKATIAISSVDFLDDVTKIMFSFRGSGSLILKDISKAK